MLLSLGLAITIWLSTSLMTWGWIKLAKAKEIQDAPERRRMHDTFIPRAGGIGIALAMSAASVQIYFSVAQRSSIWLLLVASIVLFSILGFWDDLKPIRASRKLLLHLLATSVVFLICTFLLTWDPLRSLAIALAYLSMVNIWNFMDGSNGMVGMQSLLFVIGFIALSYFSTATYYYALALAVSCLGFLPFNFPVAQVFLGDVGSHVLGAAVVGLAILACTENQWTALEILCLFSALWVDSVLTFIRRVLRGSKVTQPHRSHLYQYAIRGGKAHSGVCLYYAAWTVAVILVIGLNRQQMAIDHSLVLAGTIATGMLLHQGFRLFVLKSARSPKIPKSEA